MANYSASGLSLAVSGDARPLRDALVAEAGARAARLAARFERRLEGGGDAGETLRSMGVMARSSTALERHLACGRPGAVGASAFLERFANLRAMAAGRPMRLLTSIPDLQVDRDLARCVAMVVCELVEVVELSQVAPPDLMLALEERAGDVVLALAAVGGDAHPVPTGDGAAALRRAERLVEAAGGGLTRGVRDGMMLVGVALPVRAVPVRAASAGQV